MNFDLLVGGVRPANHNDCAVRPAGFLLHVIKYLLPYVLQDLDLVNLFALNLSWGGVRPKKSQKKVGELLS